ncbi:MAG: hypothetical protein EXR71_18520 [Myxococcales bacterium]|nr:hypothetical protein [Myxococcales bacterium]
MRALAPPRMLALLANLGPLVVFYAFDWTMGLKPAIVAASGYSIGEVLWRLYRKAPITFLFKVVATTTVGLGVIDICLASPRFFSWEASITNAAFGGWFLWLTVKGPGPFVDEMVRLRPELPARLGREHLTGLIRVLLAMTVGFHVATGALYAWIAWSFPVEEAVGLRVLYGNLAMIPFLAAVFFGLGPLHVLASRRGWLPDGEGPVDANVSVDAPRHHPDGEALPARQSDPGPHRVP